MSEEDLFEEYERNYIKEHTTSIKCYTEEAYNKLQQENKQLKEDKKKAIEWVKKNQYYFPKPIELLKILGDKENE